MDLSTWGHETKNPANETELVKEYTKEELFEIYASENTIPDVVMEYIFELENELKKLRK